MASGAGAEIKHIVRRGDDLPVMFYQQKGVSEVTEFSQCSKQTDVVSRMQTNGRFIEHIQYTTKPAADLTG